MLRAHIGRKAGGRPLTSNFILGCENTQSEASGVSHGSLGKPYRNLVCAGLCAPLGLSTDEAALARQAKVLLEYRRALREPSRQG